MSDENMTDTDGIEKFPPEAKNAETIPVLNVEKFSQKTKEALSSNEVANAKSIPESLEGIEMLPMTREKQEEFVNKNK